MKPDLTNPWVRADKERISSETRGLIDESLHGEYEAVLGELAVAGAELSEARGIAYTAQQRFDEAQHQRQLFFQKVIQ